MPRNKNKKKGSKDVPQTVVDDQITAVTAVTESQTAAPEGSVSSVYRQQQPGPSQAGEEWHTQGQYQKRQIRNLQPEGRRQTHSQHPTQEASSFQNEWHINPPSQSGYTKQNRGLSSHQQNWRRQSRISQDSQSQENVRAKPHHWQDTSSQEVVHKGLSQMDIAKTKQQSCTKELSLLNKEAGTAGRPIFIESNHIRIDFGKLEKAYHYDVEIEPNKPKKFLRDVFEQIRRKHFPERYPAFDGMKNMYSPYQLLGEGIVLSDVVDIQIPNKSKTDSFTVTIKFSTTVDLGPLRNMAITNHQQALQCVEIVLRSAPAMRSIPSGRSFFNPSQVIGIGGGKEICCGFYQAVSRGSKQYFFNIDVAHKVFPSKMNIVDLIAEMASTYQQKVSPKDLVNWKTLPKYVLYNVEKHLKGLSVLYVAPGMKKQYKVNGLGVPAREAEFTAEDGRSTTVENYFKIKRNYSLRYPMLPTIWVGAKNRENKILLPAELCTVVENQTVPMNLNDEEKTKMIRKTATSTIERKQKIMNALEEARHNDDACVRQFGFNIGSSFEELVGRVLTPPALEYSKNAVSFPQKGAWRQNGSFLKGAEKVSWVIVSLCGDKGKQCEEFADSISRVAKRNGVGLDPARGPFDYIKKDKLILADVLKFLQKHARYSLIFVIIDKKGDYSLVKQAAEIHLKVLTQCILARTLYKMDASTVGNVLLKVNAKLNGINHCLKEKPDILRACMIMGADVTHPSPQSKNIPSVAAVVASHDPNFFKYNCHWSLQPPKVEIIADLEEITKKHLYYNQQKNGPKPESIIMFRDGVSEGQFEAVKSQELAAIKRACRSFESDYEPKITFVTVQKRHHTRFFPKRKEDSEDRNLNVPAGTCVDTVITNPDHKEFYLVSHASIQGVAKPAKYTTLYDDNDFTYDQLQQLAFYLCHLFSRCNRSVGYPAPTYYAHLVAARAKAYIENKYINFDDLKTEQKKIDNDIGRENPMFFV